MIKKRKKNNREPAFGRLADLEYSEDMLESDALKMIFIC